MSFILATFMHAFYNVTYFSAYTWPMLKYKGKLLQKAHIFFFKFKNFYLFIYFFKCATLTTPNSAYTLAQHTQCTGSLLCNLYFKRELSVCVIYLPVPFQSRGVEVKVTFTDKGLIEMLVIGLLELVRKRSLEQVEDKNQKITWNDLNYIVYKQVKTSLIKQPLNQTFPKFYTPLCPWAC